MHEGILVPVSGRWTQNWTWRDKGGSGDEVEEGRSRGSQSANAGARSVDERACTVYTTPGLR